MSEIKTKKTTILVLQVYFKVQIKFSWSSSFTPAQSFQDLGLSIHVDGQIN